MKLKSLFAAVALIVSGCCESDPELKIDRATSSLKFAVIEHDDGTISRKFPVNRSLFEALISLADGDASPDPFAAPTSKVAELGEEWPARKIFEKLGVPFPDETSAEYDLNGEILTVRHTPEWVDFVQYVLESKEPDEKNINLRLEIYQVPKALALRLEQSAAEHSDHLPELEALEKIVQDGDAEFVTTCNLRPRSGQRTSYRDGVDQMLFSEFEWDTTVEPPALKPRFETRTVGTVVEVEAVLGPDDQIVDVNLSLEHHTAPPAMIPLEVPTPGNEEPVLVSSPAFHVKKLATHIIIRDGQTKLLCSWRPTGRAEFESGDLMRIAFLRADVQKVPTGYE